MAKWVINLIELLFFTQGFHLAFCADSACNNPPTFGSFTGDPAENVYDCFWDFVSCSQATFLRLSDDCCQNRYLSCCDYVMNLTATDAPTTAATTTTADSTTTTTTTTTTTAVAAAGQFFYNQPTTLIECIWQFNNCVQDKYNMNDLDTTDCDSNYTDCKMIVMGMAPLPGVNPAGPVAPIIPVQPPPSRFFAIFGK